MLYNIDAIVWRCPWRCAASAGPLCHSVLCSVCCASVYCALLFIYMVEWSVLTRTPFVYSIYVLYLLQMVSTPLLHPPQPCRHSRTWINPTKKKYQTKFSKPTDVINGPNIRPSAKHKYPLINARNILISVCVCFRGSGYVRLCGHCESAFDPRKYLRHTSVAQIFCILPFYFLPFFFIAHYCKYITNPNSTVGMLYYWIKCVYHDGPP